MPTYISKSKFHAICVKKCAIEYLMRNSQNNLIIVENPAEFILARFFRIFFLSGELHIFKRIYLEYFTDSH